MERNAGPFQAPKIPQVHENAYLTPVSARKAEIPTPSLRLSPGGEVAEGR